MPICLDNLQNQAAQASTAYSPKFFSDKLTGKGGAAPGLLSEKLNPANIDPSVTTRFNDSVMRKRSYKSGDTTVTQIPLSPIPADAWDEMRTLKLPDLADLTLIGIRKGPAHTPSELYMDLRINAIGIEETVTPPEYGVGQPTRSSLIVTNYQILLFDVVDKSNPVCIRSTWNSDAPSFAYNNRNRLNVTAKDNLYAFKFTSNPMADINNELVPELIHDGYDVMTRNIIDFFSTYEIYDAVVKRSEEWQTTVDKTLDEFMVNYGKITPFDSVERIVKGVMRWIMNYNIPLQLYRNIYQSIASNFTPEQTNMLCKQNLNLLLSDTLKNLDAVKPNIQTFTKIPDTDPHPASMAILTPEQHAAVVANEPLILVQSGAGCGKSSIILSRIDYLNACGIAPEDITVLSFTNAAADHITEKNPNVHSMTIARMIHEIYSANFAHDLSSVETIINSIDIYYPPVPTTDPPVTQRFQSQLRKIIKNDPNAFTDVNNFIEANYDEVIQILDTIGQTSLELEIIICYQRIDSLIEPPTVTSRYLIIDEVQDNSIFEFVYTLKYVNKHMESLFIVGDASQTLYEFRAANPRALNILEGSNTFKNYRLTVNFRSNQEILDFANVILMDIEANQYAQIQLQANSLAKVTEQSFLDKVHFNYKRLSRIKEFHEMLPDIIGTDIKPYVDDCLARNEQVTFLMYERDNVRRVQTELQKLYPNLNIISLVPEKVYNSTIMSEFIRRYWNEINFVPINSIVSTISREILARVQFLTYNDKKALPHVQKILVDWASKIQKEMNTWLAKMKMGVMTSAECIEEVKKNMLAYEISSNAARQSLLSSQNAKIKEGDNVQKANILLSTIHSAKGLEFDNVVVFYKNSADMAEDRKRMYYVAMTRAMKSEYIMAYDTMATPQIQTEYISLLERLHGIAPAANSPIDMLREKRKNRVKI